MASFQLLPPIEGRAYCSCGCGYRTDHIAMNVDPHPGFGGCTLTRDGECHTDYYSSEADSMVMQDFEDIAAGDPDHDWRLRIDGPLADYTYQRQSEGKWALVEQGMGFA